MTRTAICKRFRRVGRRASWGFAEIEVIGDRGEVGTR
jgi:hypothetical protein